MGYLSAHSITKQSTHQQLHQHSPKEISMTLPFNIQELHPHMWYVEDQRLPYISLCLAFKNAGYKSDPSNKSGTAQFMGAMIQEGCNGLSSQEFKELLLQKNIQLIVSVSNDHVNIGFRCLKEQVKDAVQIIQNMILKPNLYTKDFKRVSEQMKGNYMQAKHNENTVADDFFSDIVFKGHPYHLTTDMLLKSLDGLTIEDIKDFMEKSLCQDNLYVTGCGGLSKEDCEKIINDMKVALPQKNQLPSIKNVEFKSDGNIHFKEMDIPQSIILFYIEALDPTDPDFYTLDILNSIYGGAPFVSRLWFSVRENSGYAYNVGTRYQSIQQCSYIRGRTSVATENVKKTIALIQDDVKKLQNTPVEDKELKYHQDLKTGQQSVALDSTVAITQYLMTCLLMGRSVDDVNQRNHKIKSINVHDIERISKKIFSKPMTFFVVGRPH